MYSQPLMQNVVALGARIYDKHPAIAFRARIYTVSGCNQEHIISFFFITFRKKV